MGDISEKIQLVFIQFAQVVFFHSFDADIHFVSHTHLVEADNYKTDKKFMCTRRDGSSFYYT